MKTLFRRIIDCFNFVAGNRYYSQLGEDAVLAAYFKELKLEDNRLLTLFGITKYSKGCYVDIGAYSPKRISNTYYFYKKGWRGITVEPNPESKKWFKLLRPGDIHLTAAISNSEEPCYYYSQGYSGINFISEELLDKTGFTRTKVPTYSLENIMKKLDDPDNIDLLTVDCEGHDLKVLQSNNWSRYRPSVVVAETDDINSEVCEYMQKQRYSIFSWTLDSVMFRNID